MPDELHDGTSRHPRHGFRQLDPLPEAGELSRFYESRYYDLIRQGGRFPERRHLDAGGSEASRERTWISTTLHADVVHTLQEHACAGSVLDIGCGCGEVLAALRQAGLACEGVEPSAEAAAQARAAGHIVHQATLAELAADPGNLGRFGAAVALNVLEHVRDPEAFLGDALRLLRPDGLLVIRVPNDFTEFQEAAWQTTSRQRRWWLARPDHINYFNFSSLRSLLAALGCDVVAETADFPMELFLLLGLDYANQAELGARCHEMRTRYEMALPTALRRRINAALASAGVARNCLVTARRRISAH